MANLNDHGSQISKSLKDLLARLARVDTSVWVVLAAGFILALFVVWGRLDTGEALGGAIVLVALAIVLIQRRRNKNPSLTQATPQAAEVDPIVEAVAEAMLGPTLLLDRRANVVYRNSVASKAFPQIVLGTPLTYSLRHPLLLEALTKARNEGNPQTIELQQTSPAAVWYAVSITPVVLPGISPDAGQRYLVSFNDLTEQRRTENMRVDFIANASHELRTPLTSIMGFIDTLVGSAAEDPEARKNFLAIMRAQAERMSKLIEDLLSLSRIEMRQHVRPTSNVDLSRLLPTIIEGMHTQLKQADIELELNLEADVATLAGDHDELYEVFENLLDNAIKYGSDGGKIRVQLHEVNDQSGFAFRVSVQDFGEGIEPEHVPRLTERFYRLDAESSRKKKGTGLGLAIVKHIVSRHRGQLTIRSALGEGMRVEVLLPR